MTVQIEMPQLSEQDEGAALATWLVSVGDRVEKGEVIAEVETDKSTVELEAPASGTILEFLVEEGDEGIMPGAVLGTIVAEGVSADPDPTPNERSGAPIEPSPAAVTTRETPTEEGVAAANDHSLQSPAAENSLLRDSTPLARRAAVDRDVDLASLAGSGPGGRVLEQDVLRSADRIPQTIEAGPGAHEVDTRAPSSERTDGIQTVRLSAMRKTIARRMTEAKQQVPHFYLRVRCRMDAIFDVRTNLNRDLADQGRDVKISVNDFVVRAAGLALRAVPEANVRFAGDEMHALEDVDIAVAVATDGGLVTPVLRDVDQKGLATLASEIKELAQLARAGKLRPDQYQGGSFTISNLGMYGVETVYPILNQPQACILGVGAAEEQPVVSDGEITIGRVASFTLAADHRVVDGAVAAQLLAALRERLEDPLCMML